MVLVVVVVLSTVVFGGVGALIAGFQDKRSGIPALAVGGLSGLWGAFIAASIVRDFLSFDLVGQAIVALIIFVMPFGLTLLGHWIVAEIRWDERKALSGPLAEKHDASAGGDEREA